MSKYLQNTIGNILKISIGIGLPFFCLGFIVTLDDPWLYLIFLFASPLILFLAGLLIVWGIYGFFRKKEDIIREGQGSGDTARRVVLKIISFLEIGHALLVVFSVIEAPHFNTQTSVGIFDTTDYYLPIFTGIIAITTYIIADKDRYKNLMIPVLFAQIVFIIVLLIERYYH